MPDQGGAPVTEPEATPFQPGLGATLQTDDFDVLAACAPGWSQEHLQLGRGPFSGGLRYAQTSRIQFGVIDWNPGIMIRGFAPVGTAVIGVPLGLRHAMLRGVGLGLGELGLVAPAEEIDFRAAGPFRMFVVSVDVRLLEEHAQVALGRSVEELFRGARAEDPRLILERCDAFLRHEFDACVVSPERLLQPRLARHVESRLLEVALQDIDPLDDGRRLPGGAALARRAEDWMRANLDAPILMRDLCAALGVPERTLHLAFRRHRETTPMHHHKTLRLNAVYRALRDAPPGTKVADVALRWGFEHPGWFAHDYRTMFGCPPSETLRRGHARRKAAS